MNDKNKKLKVILYEGVDGETLRIEAFSIEALLGFKQMLIDNSLRDRIAIHLDEVFDCRATHNVKMPDRRRCLCKSKSETD